MMLTLYGTKGCHLCDDAEQLLYQLQTVCPIVWQYTDIALAEDLVKAYGMSIPVLKRNTGEELRWPFSVLDILAFVRVD